MRATIRITWLLLSLSFLCHDVWSADDDTSGATVAKDHSSTVGASFATSATPTVVKVTHELTTARMLATVAASTVLNTQSTLVPPAVPTTVSTAVPIAVSTALPSAAPTAVPAALPPAVPTATKMTGRATVKVDATSKSGVVAVTTVPTNIGSSVKSPAASATAFVSVTSQPVVTTPAAAPSGGSTSNVVVTTSRITVAVPVATSVKTATSINTLAGTTEATKVSTDTVKPSHTRAPTTEPPGTSPPGRAGAKSPDSTKTVPATLAQTTARTQVKLTTPTPPVSTAASTSKTATQTGARPAGLQTSSPPQSTANTQTAPLGTAAAEIVMFTYVLNSGHEEKEKKDLVNLCQALMVNYLEGSCKVTVTHQKDKAVFDVMVMNGKVKPSLAAKLYEDITKKPNDNRTLIAILASCGALLIMIVILAVCASHHRKPYSETQQHLTEELHAVENGYHDNPTLEVMEVQPEMQEKKFALNGEFNDNWIVPIDNLMKEDVVDEEDTHL